MDYKNFSMEINKLIYSDFNLEKKIIEFNKLKKSINLQTSHSRHISKILETLNANKNLIILDHGCGSCSTILYLFCLGYENIWGVDVSCDEKTLNNFLKNVCKIYERRIFNYDGDILPFNENKFDFVVSQQVLEHISFENKRKTIEEISRVMKLNSYAYFQIPHSLVPYEAHTKTWFIHWLPRRFSIYVYKLINKNHKFYKDHLFLMSPKKYKKIISEQIGEINDLSPDRISIFDNEFKEFKGVNFYIRILLSKIVQIPIFGKIIVNYLSNFIMLELIVKKNDYVKE